LATESTFADNAFFLETTVCLPRPVLDPGFKPLLGALLEQLLMSLGLKSNPKPTSSLVFALDEDDTEPTRFYFILQQEQVRHT
jgi:hypothetical protein